MTVKRAIAILIAVGACSTATLAAAQARSEFAGIVGKVVDESNSVLPGVTVSATNTDTNLVRESASEMDGTFRLLALPPGTYRLKAGLPGFSTFERRITLTVGQQAEVSIELKVGELQETLTVTGEAPIIETGKTSVGTTLAESQVRNLPLQSRNFSELALLTPGAQGHAGGNTPSFSGQRAEFNSVLVDGFDNMYQGISQADRNIFSQEAIQEFQTLANSFAPEYGKSAGGVITAVSKSGTNNFRGSGFGFFRDDAFDKPNYFQRNRPIAPFLQARYGATLGGPLARDRRFFFVAHEQQYNERPTDYDLDRTLAQLFNIPQRGSHKSWGNRGMTSGKVDLNFTAQQNASFRFNYMKDQGDEGAGWKGDEPGFMGGSGNDDSDIGVAFRLNTFFSNTTLNEIRVSYSRVQRGEKYFQTEHPGPNGPQPTVRIGGSNFGQGQGKANSNHIQKYYIAGDTLSFYRGSHELKVGAEVEINDSWEDSRYFFNGIFYFADRGAFNRGEPYLFQKGFTVGGEQPTARYIEQQYHMFAQDTWKPNERVTLNYGLRYDIEYFPKDIALGDPDYVVHTDWNNVAPRFGLSFKFDEKTQARVGGGWFYGRFPDEAALQTKLIRVDRYPWVFFPAEDATRVWRSNGIVIPVTVDQIPPGRVGEDHMIINHPKTPVSRQFSVGLDRQLTSTLALRLSFLYARGDNATRSEDLNLDISRGVPIGAGQVIPGYFRYVAPYDLVYYPESAKLNPKWDNRWVYLTDGRTAHKGLVVSLEKRMANGFQAMGSYTRSSTWDDRDQWSFNRAASRPENRAAEWSYSTTHRPHRLVVSTVWQSPFRHVLARDWNVSVVGVFQSQNAEETKANIDLNNDKSPMDRPPDMRRTVLFDDSFYRNIDLHVSRSVSMRRVRAEIIAEFFNVFDTVNYRTHRVVGFMYTTSRDASGNTVLSPDGRYGQPATAYAPFQAQIGFRLTF